MEEKWGHHGRIDRRNTERPEFRGSWWVGKWINLQNRMIVDSGQE